MKRTWMVLLAVAVALAIALPAGAKKPDKPGTGFSPLACQVEGDHFYQTIAYEAETRLYTVDLGIPSAPAVVNLGEPSAGDVLCAEVRVATGTLGDLRVRWLDYRTTAEGGCALAWARGKELRRINSGENVFAVGLSLEDWTANGGLCGAQNDADGGSMTVVVMPTAKSANTLVEVKIGIDYPDLP